ncbi:DUF4365 domain-containing protein [Streptomyces sp. A13(2022)]|uniref:DUF4365 domain-containing protein n=1 Tax=Streptomyces sp. A13(2022) TaxID=2964768 RepID=UPI0021D821E1|nr:DUF4365 domain-containing protein [Streptomyces sp. A13(2022)]MCU8591786.1 DUF4365 domain-containing protein [Streptomyces sp. A13(2022)]
MDEAELRRAGIPASAHKERASYFALALLTNSASCQLQDPHLDYDCLDVTVLGSGPFPLRGPRFDVQLKSTSSEHTARLLKNGDYSITLPAAQYQELRRPGYVPARLVMLILPTGVDVPQVRSEDGRLVLDGIMLWSDPVTWEALPPGQQSGTVVLKRENEFTAEYIRDLIKIVGNGGGR